MGSLRGLGSLGFTDEGRQAKKLVPTRPLEGEHLDALARELGWKLGSVDQEHERALRERGSIEVSRVRNTHGLHEGRHN